MSLGETEYMTLADQTFRKIEDLFADVDAEDIDCERKGDVMTMSFRGGKRMVINTQRPTRQMWMAANSRAWHFSWDGSKWLDDKDPGVELYSHIRATVLEMSAISLSST